MPAEGVPEVLVLGESVLLSGRALVHAARAVERDVAALRRDGTAPPPSLIAAAAAMRQAAQGAVAAAQARVAAVLDERDGLDTVGVAEAARLVGLSVRQVRRRVAEFNGYRLGAARTAPWLLDRALVVAEAARVSGVGRSDVRVKADPAASPP